MSEKDAIKNNISEKHIKENLYYSEYSKKNKVRGIFKVIVQKNEEIFTGQIVKRKIHRQVDENSF